MNGRTVMLAFAVVAASALATSNAAADVLTLDDAVRLALSRSPRVAEAQAGVEGSRASVAFERSRYLPRANLAAVATAGFGGSTQQLGIQGIINSPNTQNFGAGVEAGWIAYDFGRTAWRVDAARAGVESATARARLFGRAAALETASAFEAAVLAEEDVRATAAVIELRARGADAARALAAAGLRPELEAMLAASRVDEAKAALEVARANVQAERERLSALLDTRLSAATQLAVAEPRGADYEGAARGAEPAVRDPLGDVARAELTRARALEKAATAEHLPLLVVAGSAGYAHRRAPDDPGYWAAGVGITVPLFTFIAEDARAREAGAAARAVAAQAASADIELRAQLGRESAVLRGARASIAAADASLGAAKAALDAAEVRYRAGQLSFVDVDVTRDTFVRIESTRRRLGLQASVALARLRIWSAAPPTMPPR